MDEGHAKVEYDLRPGGKYVLKMIRPDGEIAYAPEGKYLEIDPPRKLSMTWSSEGFIDHSVLSFELSKVDGGTEIILRHELPEFTVADHRDGWTTCLNHCEKFFEG
ncbi:SRPBCC domain-containing protein [Opitutia bacterium ISCC 51]|nr:SRPBCC domain-containing protein [Opitutae bacterium ISCC 51]QXD29698.1 SRPBCC domain-containing protein [Opitutae bacterium ISCC 52]